MALKPASVQWAADGSLLSLDYGDVYFLPRRGVAESRYVFIEKNRLEERFAALSSRASFHIAELGFGSGLNFLLTAAAFQKQAPEGARLVYASVEKHPIAKADLEKIHALFPDVSEFSPLLLEKYPLLIEGFHTIDLAGGRIRLILMLGDVMDVLPQIVGNFDAWFLDGFSPEKNPAMWNQSLFHLMKQRTVAGGTVTTFSAAGYMRQELAEAGFTVQRIKGYGYKRHMTVATLQDGAPHQTPPETVRVIGAGIGGAGVAHALAKRGIRVTVFDKNEGAAGEASGNPLGIVYPKLTMPQSPLGHYHSHAFCFTRSLLQDLSLPSWRPCGVMHLDLDEEDRARTDKIFDSHQYPKDYAERLPEGFLQPNAGFLSPAEFCERLLEHPRIETIFGTAVKPQEGTITVIAAGTQSASFAATEWLPLQFLRGQITLLWETSNSRELAQVICHDGYIIPSQNGQHCIGATFGKEPPATPEVRMEDHLQNLAKLNTRLPHLGFTEKDIAGGRTAWRVTTPDKLPLAGPCPDSDGNTISGLYIAAGFGAHGLTGAPLAGDVMAALICGEPLPIPKNLLDTLLPDRFQKRAARKKKP